MYSLVRSIYRRVRSVPVLGSLAEAIRYRRFPRFDTTRGRLVRQQTLIEAHGHAITGLRQALARQEELCRELGAELGKQAHHLNVRIDETRDSLDDRVEFARREALLELRYADQPVFATSPDGTSAAGAPAARSVSPRILNPDRLAAQRRAGGLRLNVGCGHRPDPERINIDMRELPGVDVVALIDDLPFEPGSVQEMYSSHVLEHFPLEQLRRRILPAWVRLLCPGGQLRAVVPDAEAMLAAHARGEIGFETLRLVTFGGQEYEGDFHHNMFTPDSLAQLLTEHGFVDIAIPARARRNGDCLEFEIVGTLAADRTAGNRP